MIQEELVAALKAKKLKISTAESFTGGEIARRIVGVSGASEVFIEGIVAYSERAKTKRLGVKNSTLEKFKPVSEEVASEMLGGIEKDCDLAISTTGLAGPNSDDSGFPVGLCFIGVSFKGKRTIYKYNFTGNRNEIVSKGAETALLLALDKIKTQGEE
ncbi:MAG: CinA family protein [Clostridia bacterium]|nr:CinA family protein [Clostridia bacterium]